jgi:hypothetical protein
MTTEPLIHTTLGNVPISSLRYETEWEINDEYIRFTERHIDSGGSVVKQSSHVRLLTGAQARLLASEQG